MPGARPPQAGLTRDNDRSKTEATCLVVEGMVDGLNDHVLDGIGTIFDEKFRWIGNAGCGTTLGLKALQDNWPRSFQAVCSDKVCIDEACIAEGEWMAAFGSQTATPSVEFVGIATTLAGRWGFATWTSGACRTAGSWTTGSWSTSPECCGNSASMCSMVRAGRLTTRVGASPRVRPRRVDRG